MRATGGPQKLRFTVVSFSGEDTDYPVRELLFHSPQTRGWQTPRLCSYPQEIVFKLEAPSKVKQIQMLSHEYKIATKVEVFVAVPNPGEDVSKAPFKRLGYLSFDSNERSDFQARELKSVHVDVPAYFIRLVIHRCHVNKLNIYNQVGLIALNLIGEPIGGPPDVPPGGYLQLHPPISREVAYYNQAAADVADINLDIHVDTVTAAKIRELARAKDAAVANEDYDEAKRLKASIDRLKVVGQKIAQLEARKRAAVEKEDYDTAKQIKLDIDKLRATGESAAISSEQFAPRPNKNPDDIFNRVLKNKAPVANSIDNMPVRGMSSSGAGPGAAGAPGAGEVVEEEPGLAQEPSMGNMDAEPGLQAEGSYAAQPSLHHSRGNLHGTSYDERPAQGRGRYTPSEEHMAEASMQRPGGGAAFSAAAVGIDAPVPSGWPRDLPAPEPLTDALRKDSEPLQEMAGEYVASAINSKNWQLRDAAMTWLVQQVKDGQFTDRRDAFRILTKAVQKAMKDKVANVIISALDAFQVFIDGFAAVAGARDVQSACEMCLPVLLEKLGDNNARLRDAAREKILFIAGLESAGLRNSTHLLVKPIKNQNAWRPILGILSILQELVPVYGISKTGEGFELGELMEFVGKTYNSPNAELRAMAIKVTKEVYDLVGPAIRKTLPKDINPKIKEQLDAVLGGDAGPPPAAAPPPPARSAPAPRAAPAAAASASKAPPAKARAAAAPAPKQAAAPPPPPPPAPAMAAQDDPAAFEAELARREQTLGPDHPDVAETLTNLAIVYNQRGEGDHALPLYERALSIYEKQYGPDHPEVAHTLTDLAVLHLEAGRDGVGRPLLERALAIQEKALGPDHPDVIAIKDVLNSE